ncbi:FadR/GntR family transcriptional regulator [Marinivivus vitaminiproducens]|uniref:FadR/GntR family transcriptional regulator n=1 Tax=Marinivivus vitaminiproducens TaxID=3035935 RepID=UPI0027A926DF|nr:FCD domain-containing protein [Geminicoccaceae bacterium SCSIO 64248]
MSSHAGDIDARLRSLLDHMPAHDRLPPERDLAIRFRTTRAAVRRVLDSLEAEGRVRRHVGRGTFVLRPPTASAAMPHAAIAVTNPAEVMEARAALEPRIAALAAMHASAQDIGEMERILAKAGDALRREVFEDWDNALHQAIARSCRNGLLIALFDAVNAVRGEALWGRLKTRSLTRDRQAAYGDDHAAIVGAIRDRDMSAAERAMRVHIERVQRHILATLAGTSDDDSSL